MTFCGKLFESRMTLVESSTKTWWLSFRGLRKQDQDDFHWKLYEIRMTFVERSTKARWVLNGHSEVLFRADLSKFVKSPFWWYKSATKNPEDLSGNAVPTFPQHLPPCIWDKSISWVSFVLTKGQIVLLVFLAKPSTIFLALWRSPPPPPLWQVNVIYAAPVPRCPHKTINP